MKLVLVFFAILGLAFGKPVPVDDGTFDQLSDRLAIAENLEHLRKILARLESEEFHKLVLSLEHSQEFHSIVDYLNSNGIQIKGLVNYVHESLGWEPYEETVSQKVRRETEDNKTEELVKTIIASAPVEKVQELAATLAQSNSIFKVMYDIVFSSEFQAEHDDLKATPEYQEFIEILSAYVYNYLVENFNPIQILQIGKLIMG